MSDVRQHQYMQSVRQFISNLPPGAESLKSLVSRYEAPGNPISAHGFSLSHRPLIAPEAYAVRLYFPLPASIVRGYLAHNSIAESEPLCLALESLNGAHLFELDLYGISPSMVEQTPLLDRSQVPPFDIAQANQELKSQLALSPGEVVVASGPHPEAEVVHYVMSTVGSIKAIAESVGVVGSWSNYWSFLDEALPLAEAAYPEYEAFMRSLKLSPGNVA